ncbi:hypothetical protein [Puniceibacterium sp. IMCC21224]|uniref:hypothetical protein n=1 Tax=Puniceibacterium sp. IMCC21224 TaxID=1618204 RepID=UPI00065D2B9B|nr:hypothetical protein [Puniceibacterium sp. IMCC21224]KMK65869.1 hypothetical protein IMCC21224_11705 [Puniceibacterium sp. IMCC21224]
MTPPQILSLAISAVIFAVWGWLMFHTLFELRRRAIRQTGHSVPGPGAALHQ